MDGTSNDSDSEDVPFTYDNDDVSDTNEDMARLESAHVLQAAHHGHVDCCDDIDWKFEDAYDQAYGQLEEEGFLPPEFG